MKIRQDLTLQDAQNIPINSAHQTDLNQAENRSPHA